MADNLTPDPNQPSSAGRRPTPTDEPGWERAALERIALAAISEQRAARRWKIFFRLVLVILLLLVVWGMHDFSGVIVATTGRHTAQVPLVGEIPPITKANAEVLDAALESAFDYVGGAGVM